MTYDDTSRVETTPDVRRLSLRERLRRWSYLQDVDLWLSSLPGRRRRAILRELKTSLSDAAAETSMADAIDELGPARRLAREYVDGEPANRPIWYQGAIAALVVLMVSFLLIAAYTTGMIAALGDSATKSTASSTFLGVHVTAENSPSAYGAQFQGFSWPILIMGAVAWLLGARAWRLLRQR